MNPSWSVSFLDKALCVLFSQLCYFNASLHFSENTEETVEEEEEEEIEDTTIGKSLILTDT